MSVEYPDREGQKRAAEQLLPRVRASLKKDTNRLKIERQRWARARRRGDREAMARTMARGKMFGEWVEIDKKHIAVFERMMKR